MFAHNSQHFIILVTLKKWLL